MVRQHLILITLPLVVAGSALMVGCVPGGSGGEGERDLPRNFGMPKIEVPDVATPMRSRWRRQRSRARRSRRSFRRAADRQPPREFARLYHRGGAGLRSSDGVRDCVSGILRIKLACRCRLLDRGHRHRAVSTDRPRRSSALTRSIRSRPSTRKGRYLDWSKRRLRIPPDAYGRTRRGPCRDWLPATYQRGARDHAQGPVSASTDGRSPRDAIAGSRLPISRALRRVHHRRSSRGRRTPGSIALIALLLAGSRRRGVRRPRRDGRADGERVACAGRSRLTSQAAEDAVTLAEGASRERGAGPTGARPTSEQALATRPRGRRRAARGDPGAAGRRER